MLATLQTVTCYNAESEYLLVLATLQTVTLYNAENEYLLVLATLQTCTPSTPCEACLCASKS